MKKIIVNSLFILFLTNTLGQQISLDWLSTNAHNDIYASKNSAFNSYDSCIYTIGVFQGAMGSTQFQLNSTFGKSIFLQKTNSFGDIIWLKKIADMAYNVDLTTRATISSDDLGNLIAGISFNDKLYFNSDSIIAPNIDFNQSIGLFKLDTASNIIWSKQVYSTMLGFDGITTDLDNNIIIAGGSSEDVFISKYSATGDSLWTRYAGGANGYDVGNIVKTDSMQNIYLAGVLQPSNGIYFDAINPTFTSPYNDGSFIAKYNSLGGIQWVRCFYSTNFGNNVFANSFDFLSENQIVIGGSFLGSNVRFYPPSTALTSINNGSTSSFLLSYDADGNMLWKKNPHNNFDGSIGLGGITKHSTEGFICTVGYSGQVAVLGDTLVGSSAYGSEILQKIDSQGNQEWYYHYGGNGLDFTTDIFANDNSIYLVSSTNSSAVNFGNTPYSLVNSPGFYIAKLEDNTVSISDNSINEFSIYPNPSNENAFIKTELDVFGQELSLFNELGQLISNQQLNNSHVNSIYLPKEKGIYFLKISGTELGFLRVVKI